MAVSYYSEETNREPTDSTLFSGVSAANATVAMLVANETYTTTSDTEGYWELSIPVQSVGEFDYTLTVTDDDGVETQHTDRVAFDSSLSEKPNDVLEIDLSSNTVSFEGVTQPGADITLTVLETAYVTKANELGEWNIDTTIASSLAIVDYEVVTTLDGVQLDAVSDTALFAKQQSVTSESQEETHAYNETHSAVFEGSYPADTREISFEFNGMPLNVEISEDNTTWHVEVTADIINTTNEYTVSIVNGDGSTSTATGEYEQESISMGGFAAQEQGQSTDFDAEFAHVIYEQPNMDDNL
ncbi:hypothetical protein DDN69_18820 [Vibrio cholerae]|nr:hypothetical protein [Vibrio cholerae]